MSDTRNSQDSPPGSLRERDKTAPRGGHHRATYAGIHLSGANAHKTALAVIAADPDTQSFNLLEVYERIGSFGTLFSDDRLVEILAWEGPFREVFVDCPLSQPPCVTCQRAVCPGAMRCEDPSVAYLLRLSEQLRPRRGRRGRPINPQTQRVWDVTQALNKEGGERLEPSYSANLAPLVTRAKTLQRRLASADPGIELRETSVPLAIQRLAVSLGFPDAVAREYRNFEKGWDCRRQLLAAFVDQGWLAPLDSTQQAKCARLEAFQALTTGMVAAWHGLSLTTSRPKDFLASEGWVYLPTLVNKTDKESLESLESPESVEKGDQSRSAASLSTDSSLQKANLT